MSDIYAILSQHNIPYKKFEHEAVFTNEESGKVNIPEVNDNAKNLFLRNQDKSQFYLLTIKHDKRADLKNFARTVNEKKLSFGSPEDLKAIMDLTPGSVSPLGLINDTGKKIEFWLDQELFNGEKICVHPNINTGTLVIGMADFKRLIGELGYNINIASLD